MSVIVFPSSKFRIVHFLYVFLSFLTCPFSLLLSEVLSLSYSRLLCIVLLLSYRFVVTSNGKLLFAVDA